MYKRTNAWEMLDRLIDKSEHMDIVDDILTMSFDVPGLSKSDIKIIVDGRVITLEGENEDRTFNKQYKISEHWDITQADASVVNGVLTLSIPKIKEKKTKVLEIIVK